jgi:hypothetical protein
MNTIYKATVIDNLYINQESRDFIDKMKVDGYKYIIRSKNQDYFELEFMLADETFDGIKNKLIRKIGGYYYNLFNDFLGLYYHGRHHYPNDKYVFKKN